MWTEILSQRVAKSKTNNQQGVHGQGKSSGKIFFKVRELSGNFETCQGILEFNRRSGKSQGIRNNQSISEKNIKNKG